MKQFLSVLFFCSVLFNSALFAQQQTQVKFQIKNFGLNVLGKFKEVKIHPSINLWQLDKSSITSEIQVNSIYTGNGKRDAHLKSEDYFDENTYPTIRLRSTKIIEISPGKYNMTAQLTIKETTREVIIPLEITKNQDQLTLKAAFSINRQDYKVGGDSWTMGDIVKVSVLYKGKNE
ncbi:YceI family protein [Flavobacteriaceae bacterium F08102]|nr:YceI family protein [Flavobacteriaceae bacterium F08102]